MTKLFEKAVLPLIFAVILITPMIQKSYATQDYYQQTGFHLVRTPLICILEPNPDSNIPNLGSTMVSMAENAIQDWRNQLNQGGGKKPLYNMGYIVIPLSDQQNGTYFFSTCDIQIAFKTNPTAITYSSTNTTDPVGLTWWYPTHQASIVLFYQTLQYKEYTTQQTEFEGGNQFIMNYYHYVPYYSDTMASQSQLQYAMDHELGHAFGLGHYIVSQTEMNAWSQGTSEPLSIMISQVSPVGYEDFTITPRDVAQVKSIYENGGFNAFLNPTVPNDLNLDLKSQVMNDINTFGHPSWDDISSLRSMLTLENLSHTGCAGDLGTPYLYWFNNVLKFWVAGLISDYSMANSIEYENLQTCQQHPFVNTENGAIG
ncbi:MAG: hypothetical protein ACREBB_04675 [Nitrosotalea sp.]